MIEFQDTGFAYSSESPVIPSLSGRWEKGRLHALIGPSGCGKSTLLYLIAGLIRPTAGTLLVSGEQPLQGRRNTAVILQNHGLFPWKNVRDNLALGLKIRKEDSSVLKSKVSRVIREMGLDGRDKAYLKELSGGERQRLAIGRALVLDPDLLLLDEPFSALDAMTRERLQDRLWELKHPGLTIVHVTHSIEEAVFLGDRIHIMDASGALQSVENQSPGPGYRMESGYFDRCVALRRLFEQYAGGAE